MKHDNGQFESAIVIGASLSGLMTAIALAQEGIRVTILEKVSMEPRTGSALQVNNGISDKKKTAKLLRNLASGGKKSIQLWSSIESRLRAEALADTKIKILYNIDVETLEQDENSVWAITKDGETFRADILIGADGHRSMVRPHISPENPDAIFAGYIVWVINTISEEELSDSYDPNQYDTGVRMFEGSNGFLFGSIIEGGAFSTSRQIGCAWYDNSRTYLLRDLGCLKGNVVNHSLKGDDIPQKTIDELASHARKRWPEPWLTATLKALETRENTGIPIKEYLPEKLIKGRIAIVGDAAHVPAPITASGFNESLKDASFLGECVADGISGKKAIKALEKYEKNRLTKVRQMVKSGQSFSRSFGRL